MVSVTPWTTTTPQDDSRVSCEHIERETGQDVCPVVSGDGLLRCRGEDSTPEFGEAACYLDGGFNRCGWKMLVMPDGTPWYLKWTDPRTKDEGGFCS